MREIEAKHKCTIAAMEKVDDLIKISINYG